MSPLDQGPACQEDFTQMGLVTGHSSPSLWYPGWSYPQKRGPEPPHPAPARPQNHTETWAFQGSVQWWLWPSWEGVCCEQRSRRWVAQHVKQPKEPFLYPSLERLIPGSIDSMWTSLFWRPSAETPVLHYFSLKVNKVLHVSTLHVEIEQSAKQLEMRSPW